MNELPSDRLVRRWYRAAMFVVGLCCLAGGTVALLDGKAVQAIACAVVGFAWVVIARVIIRE